ncbi:MAG: hypothetical protein LKI53_08755 [Bacteroidales bacterium]|jgi:hypothetical protein|nr:hypothetical protein [Bacteroidales bacterium]
MILLNFVKIKCNSTEGWVTDDQIYLKVNGKKVFGDYKMGKGKIVELAVEPIDFVSPLELRLYDHDTFDPDDCLGLTHVIANDYGVGKKTVNFNKDGANYDLTYQIISGKYLKFEKIKCNSTEGWVTDDQIYLKVNGKKVFGNYEMGKGKTIDLTKTKGVSFTNSVELKLYDHDAFDPDDFLGSNTVSDLGTEKLSFKEDGANYDLNINVLRPLEYLVKDIRKIVGENADGTIKVTREKLGISDDLSIQVDVGGEGYKKESITSGFKAALNMNNVYKTTTTPPYLPIENLIKIKDWNVDYPFADNFADYVTIQGCPLTDHNVNEIARIIKNNGEVGLWLTDGYERQTKALAKKLNSTVETNPFDEFNGAVGGKKIKIIARK